MRFEWWRLRGKVVIGLRLRTMCCRRIQGRVIRSSSWVAKGVTQLESLAARIDGEALSGQRKMFNPAQYAKSRKVSRRGPFV